MLELVLRCTCKINDLCKFWIMFHCCFIDNFANWIIEPFTAPYMSCVVHIQSNDTSTSKGKVILQILGLCRQVSWDFTKGEWLLFDCVFSHFLKIKKEKVGQAALESGKFYVLKHLGNWIPTLFWYLLLINGYWSCVHTT